MILLETMSAYMSPKRIARFMVLGIPALPVIVKRARLNRLIFTFEVH
jgi:hypothetical protein